MEAKGLLEGERNPAPNWEQVLAREQQPVRAFRCQFPSASGDALCNFAASKRHVQCKQAARTQSKDHPTCRTAGESKI